MTTLPSPAQDTPPDEPNVTESLLTPRDLSTRLVLPLDTIYAMNRSGKGPRRLAIGKHVRYRLADVVEWENTRYVEQSA